MEATDILLYGASGHAKVICSILEAQCKPLRGLFDDNDAIDNLNGYTILGMYDAKLFSDLPLIIAIGDNRIRKEVFGRIKHRFVSAIHPQSSIDRLVTVGAGSVIMHGVLVQRDTKIGNHCIINSSASVDHDCFIGDFVHIAPNATICGNVRIDEGTMIGAGAVIIPNIKIGKWCIIGAGAVVLNDVADFSVVVGNPGRIIKNKQ